jgi:hypothetical protein
LTKTGDVWTLHDEVSPLRPRAHAGCLGLMAYWVATDPPAPRNSSSRKRRLTVHRERFWFGAPRAFAFTDVVALYAVKSIQRTVD